MPLFIDVDDVSVGDYSTEHGTVMAVIKSDKSDSVELKFHNGDNLNLTKGTELEFLQGGRFDRPIDLTTKHKKRD